MPKRLTTTRSPCCPVAMRFCRQLSVGDILLPSGDQLNNGDSFVVTHPDGTDVTVRFVNALTSSNDVQVLFNSSQSAAEVAAAVAAAVPSSLGPRINGGGRLSLLAATDIQVDGLIQAGQANPVIVQTTGQLVDTPTGDEATDGEVLTVTLPNGQVIPLTYRRLGNQQPGASGEIVFQSGETKLEVAQSIVDALPPQVAFIDSFANVVFLDPATTATITPAPSLIAVSEVPDTDVRTLVDVLPGNQINDDEVIRFQFGGGTGSFTVAFDDGDGVDPGIPHDAVVAFSDGDSVADVVSNLNAAIQNQAPAMDPMIVGDTLSVLTDFNSGDDIVDTRQNPLGFQTIEAVRIDIPVAPQLVNGEQLTITVDGAQFNVTFNDATGAGGPGIVTFNGPASGGADTSINVIADRLANTALPANLDIGVFGGSVVHLWHHRGCVRAAGWQ